MSYLLFICFGLGAIVITRSLHLSEKLASIVFFPVIFVALILISGYSLSSLNLLGEISAWTFVASLLATGSLIYLSAILFSNRLGIFQQVQSIDLAYQFRKSICSIKDMGFINAITLIALTSTVLYLAKINLYLVLKIAPGNWDSMTYHLARMAYYLQQGNLSSFNADYWAQVVHPKNSTILMIFAFLGSSRNENWTQLVQYMSYWLAIFSVYANSRILNIGRAGSLFAAGILGLLTTSLMEASTTQNDLLIASLISCSLYGFLAWRKNKEISYLLLCILCVSISIGVKSAALLALPSILLIAFFAWPINIYAGTQLSNNSHTLSTSKIISRNIGKNLSKKCTLIIVIGAGIFCLFTLPAGYYENWMLYKHPIGPESVRKMHSFEGNTPAQLLQDGAKNSLRYSLEFISLDGYKNTNATTAHTIIRQHLQNAIEWIGINLEEERNTRHPFKFSRMPISHEDKSYWGVLGFLIIWPLILISFFKKSIPIPIRALTYASALFLAVQAISGPFDPWRGRYFLTGAVFATPVVGYYFDKYTSNNIFIKIYFFIAIILGCQSAIEAVLERENNIPMEIRQEDRLGQLLRNTGLKTQHRQIEKLIGPNAKIAVALPADSYEYPLFGEKLTRNVIPINHFMLGLRPIPPESEYLIFSKLVMHNIEPSDISLGGEWYLRILN